MRSSVFALVPQIHCCPLRVQTLANLFITLLYYLTQLHHSTTSLNYITLLPHSTDFHHIRWLIADGGHINMVTRLPNLATIRKRDICRFHAHYQGDGPSSAEFPRSIVQPKLRQGKWLLFSRSHLSCERPG